MIDLKAIRKRAEKATPGPWTLYHEKLRPTFSNFRVIEVQSDEETPIIHWGGFDDCGRSKNKHLANARFIARARTDIPAICDEVERLRNALSDVTRVCASRICEDDEWPNDVDRAYCIAREALRATLGGNNV